MLQNFYESISPTVRPVRGGAACGITGHLFSLSRCHSAILTKPLTLWVPQFLQLWNEQNSPSSSCSLLRKVKRRLSLHDEGLIVPFLEMQDFSSLSSLTVIQVIYFFWGGGKNTGVSCHSLLQEIFPTQGSNPGLPHCRQMLYHLSTGEVYSLFK